MTISFIHSYGAEAPIAVPAIGLDLLVPGCRRQRRDVSFASSRPPTRPAPVHRAIATGRRRSFVSSKDAISTR